MLPLGKASRLEPDVEARDNGRRGHEKIVRDDENSARVHVQSEHSVTVLPKYPRISIPGFAPGRYPAGVVLRIAAPS